MIESKNDPILQEDLEINVSSTIIPWEKFENSTILITGATGLIGSQIIKTIACYNRIKKQKIKVLACIRNLEKAKIIFEDIFDRPEIKFIETDITKPFEIDEPIQYFIHTASFTSSQDFVNKPVDVIETSIYGTNQFLKLALQKKAKGAVYLSSMEAFGVKDNSKELATEKDLGYIDLSNVRSCYPESKRLSENLCTAYASQYNLPVKIARLSQTFGAGILYSENRIFAQFAKSVIEGKDIELRTKGLSWGNYCYTRDTIQGVLLLLIQGEKGEAYTITNEATNIRIRDMAEMVANKIAMGNIKVIFNIPESNLTYGYAPDTELHLSSAKIRALGWEASVSLEEAYKRLIQSLRYNK
ncbi:MAG: NAD(P)-dependent oxidoreductase [Crenarchaeota archaeon]|jgi:nucleoside-diphosphate-sugar epimerase|nr:NAD(P)-dependent oxidoreductase [Thermoproteota archaeon]